MSSHYHWFGDRWDRFPVRCSKDLEDLLQHPRWSLSPVGWWPSASGVRLCASLTSALKGKNRNWKPVEACGNPKFKAKNIEKPWFPVHVPFHQSIEEIWRDKLIELNRQTQRPLARRSPLDLHRWEKQIQERPRRMRRLGHKKRMAYRSPNITPILSTTLLFSSAIFQFARSERRDVESMWAIPWRCGHVCIMHYCKQFWFQTFACSDSFSLLNSTILSAWVTLKSAFCILFVAMSWFPPMLSLSSYSHLRYLRTVSIWRPCRMCAWRAPTKPCTSSWGAWAWKHPQAEHVVPPGDPQWFHMGPWSLGMFFEFGHVWTFGRSRISLSN